MAKTWDTATSTTSARELPMAARRGARDTDCGCGCGGGSCACGCGCCGENVASETQAERSA